MKTDIEIAEEAAIEAGKIILSYYKSGYSIKEKGYKNPVTTADYESDNCIKKLLTEARPEYGWLSEETADNDLRIKREKVWVVDPLDGTKEFIEGVPNFVVSIGLVENGIPIVGVLYNPITQEIFRASKGDGAFLNGNLINCISKENISDMVILNSRSETRKGLWEDFESDFGVLKPVGSVAYKLGLTAAGAADVFASLRPKNEWDICAGNCIINEASGKLIDLNGKQRLYNQKNTLIKSGLIAGSIRAVDKTYKILKKVINNDKNSR